MTSPLGESRGGTPVGERIPKGIRAASVDAELAKQRFPAFRFLFSFVIAFCRHCERSEAIQSLSQAALDCFVAIAPRNDGFGETGVAKRQTRHHHPRTLFRPELRASRGWN